MDEAEEFYQKKYEDVQKRLADPDIGKKIDAALRRISKLVDCGVEINFIVTPHVENYEEIQDSENYEIPTIPTMKLSRFIEYLQQEKDGDMDVYVDPIYLKMGVNQIADILITTLEKKMIIVPIANKKKN